MGTTARASGDGASDLVSGRPHHLRIMADHRDVVVGRAVCVVLVLDEPLPHHVHPVCNSYYLVLKTLCHPTLVFKYLLTMAPYVWTQICSGRTDRTEAQRDSRSDHASGTDTGSPTIAPGLQLHCAIAARAVDDRKWLINWHLFIQSSTEF